MNRVIFLMVLKAGTSPVKAGIDSGSDVGLSSC